MNDGTIVSIVDEFTDKPERYGWTLNLTVAR